MEIPRIISVDDHVLEPPDLWSSRLPVKLRADGPRVVREKGANVGRFLGTTWVPDGDLAGATWCDVWYYEDIVRPIFRGMAHSGYESEDALLPITFDDMLPAAYQQMPRLDTMERNHTDVSMCFPSFQRFCGQIFLNRTNKDLALAAVQTYNDWIIDEWCAGDGFGRLIPLTLIPLWDPTLAAAEVRRCASKGSHSIAFSECPPYLGLPSIYTDYWDPVFAACQDTDTVINIHVGSSSNIPDTAPGAGPADMKLCLIYINSILAFTDWIYSGVLEEYSSLRLVLSESQAGWIPFAAQRADNTWVKGNEMWKSEAGGRRARQLPSSVSDRVFACIFDDLEGLRNRDAIGTDRILFESDFPHADSTYPHTKATASRLVEQASLSEAEIYKVFRGNAIRAYGLDRYFGVVK